METQTERERQAIAPLRLSPVVLLQAYRAYFRKTFAVQLQYRASLLIWLIGTMLEPTIYLVVWSTVARAGDGSVNGFTPADFAAYYIAIMFVEHLTFTWIMWEYDYRIRMGQLSTMLLRPIHPVHEDIADNLTYKVLTLVVLLPVAALLTLLFQPAWNGSWWSVVLFVPALALAFLVRFTMGWSLAMLAFWTTRIEAFSNIFFVLELFFSGRLAPLEVLPAGLQSVARVLPFQWALSFPVELLLGRLSPREAVTGLGVQLLWLAISLLLMRLVWRAGIRKYAAFGS